MSLVLKYFKRKLKPFKQCVDNQSKSFDLESSDKSASDNNSSTKKSSLKFNIKLIKRNKNKVSKVKETKQTATKNNNDNNSVAIVPNTIDNSFGEEDDNEIERKSISNKHQQILFNTPVSSMCSIDDNQAPSRYQMIIKSTDHEYLLNSSPSSSCYTYNVPTNSCSSYEETTCFGSIINSTPTNSYTSSMITKYVDEDGLLSVSVLMLPQSQSVNEQQSTPFTENYAKIKCLKKEDQPTSATNTLKKCRRSNTTYTIAGSKTNNQIIDYFNKLELSKPIKKQAVIRKLNDNNKKQNGSFESTSKNLKEEAKNLSNANEIEKIQDVLFYDEPSMLNENNNNNQTNENNTFEMSLNNNAGSQNEPVLDSTTNSSIKYETEDDDNIDNDESKNLIESRKEISINNDNSKSTSNVRLNETHLVNLSIEKLRRSLSFPVLQSQSGSPISANSSKISFVKDCDISNEKSKSQQEEEQPQQPQQKLQKQPFVRGDPQTRVSKNIKQMFKNVVKYQMNALNSLEKFYEAQIAKFDLERKRNLAMNPTNTEKINQYFDAQIKLLEDRVHANLKLICENKSQQVIQEPVNNTTTNNKSILSRRLSQVMLLKQLEIQQKKSTGANSTNQRLSRSNLKANLLAMNQNNILPSKKIRNASSGIPKTTSNNNFEYDETTDLKETIFKRNLSLPYHQCKQNAAMILNKELTERINSNNNLRLARRLESSQSNRQSTTTHSLSAVRRDSSNNGFQSNGLKANHNIVNNAKMITTSYQKNNVRLRQQSTSNENVSSSHKSSTQSINIKRQNKSQLSLKSSPTITNEQSVISNIQQTNESSLFNAHDTGKFSNSSNFSITLSKSNCSLFNNSIFDSISSSNSNSTNNSCHLVKYQPPRYSDSHIQFRLNQQKLALLKSAQEFKKMSCLNNANGKNESKTSIPPSTNLTTEQANSNSNFFKIETQV